MTLFKRIWRGAGYVPGCGYHPGTIVILIMTVFGAMGGYARNQSFFEAAQYGLIFGGIFLPFYLYGCWDRGGHYE